MDQLEATRIAGKINKGAIEAGHKAMKPGVTLLEIDAIVEQHITSNNCIPIFKGYRGYPNTSCLSPNDVVVHGVPNDYALKDGDILTIDVGCSYEGWMVDSARTFVLRNIDRVFRELENPYRLQERLIFASESVLEAQLSVIKSGCSLLDIVKAAEAEAEKNFGSIARPSPKLNIFHQWCGHKIGKELHMDPSIRNCIDPTLSKIKRQLLEREYGQHKFKTGDIICIEPVCTFGSTDFEIDVDGWTIRSKDKSLVAHEEKCILIQNDGYEVLS